LRARAAAAEHRRTEQAPFDSCCKDCPRHQSTVTARTILEQDPYAAAGNGLAAAWGTSTKTKARRQPPWGSAAPVWAGIYQTVLTTLRPIFVRAMCVLNRDRLKGLVESDEAYWPITDRRTPFLPVGRKNIQQGLDRSCVRILPSKGFRRIRPPAGA